MVDNNIYTNIFNGDNIQVTVNVRNKNGRTVKQIIINSDGNITIKDKEKMDD